MGPRQPAARARATEPGVVAGCRVLHLAGRAGAVAVHRGAGPESPDGDRFPEVGQQAPQYLLEELLREAVLELPACTLATGVMVTDLEQDAGGVRVTVADAGGQGHCRRRLLPARVRRPAQHSPRADRCGVRGRPRAAAELRHGVPRAGPVAARAARPCRSLLGHQSRGARARRAARPGRHLVDHRVRGRRRRPASARPAGSSTRQPGCRRAQPSCRSIRGRHGCR